MIDAAAEAGDQAQPVGRAFDQRRVDLVGDGRDQHVAFGHGAGHCRAIHRRIGDIEARVEQFGHARFHIGRQAARDDDARLGGTRRSLARFLSHARGAIPRRDAGQADKPLALTTKTIGKTVAAPSKRLWVGHG